MNPATHGREGSATAPVLYMALELSNKSWRLAFGDGTKRRQVSVPAADLAKRACAAVSARGASVSRFCTLAGIGASARPRWARIAIDRCSSTRKRRHTTLTTQSQIGNAARPR